MGSTLRSPIARLAGGLLLIAAAVAICPNRAEAACGDYVIILDGRAVTDHAMPGPSGGEQLPKAPCHGPGCSKLPNVPFAPVSVPSTPLPDSKAFAFGVGDQPPADLGRAIPDSSTSIPVHQPGSIFHPPRV